MRISDWSSDVCSSDLHSGGTRCLVTLVDRTAEVRTEQHLRREMLTDSLTGLPNRAGFSDRLESMIEAGRVASCAVLVVDLDRFSRVNACQIGRAHAELQSLMRISYAVFCLKKKKTNKNNKSKTPADRDDNEKQKRS